MSGDLRDVAVALSWVGNFQRAMGSRWAAQLPPRVLRSRGVRARNARQCRRSDDCAQLVAPYADPLQAGGRRFETGWLHSRNVLQTSHFPDRLHGTSRLLAGRDGQLRGSRASASGEDRGLGVLLWRVVQLINHVAVRGECEPGAVAELAGDVDH